MGRCWSDLRSPMARRKTLAIPTETHPAAGVPREDLPCTGDVRLAHLGVVDGQRLVDDLAWRAGRREDCLGQLEDRVLPRVADVDGQVLARLGEQDQPPEQVVDVAEA